jgi:hypothetical protein
MSVPIEDVILELSLVLELARPESAPASAAELVVALEFMLLAEFPPFSMVLPLKKLPPVVLLVIFNQYSIATWLVEREVPEVDEFLSIQLAISCFALILI